jgi:biotin carboxylase
MNHIVVITRWRERYAEYERYLDHQDCAVTYITTETGTVPATAAGTWIVRATDDLAEVREGVRALAARHGAPTAIIALKEDDLLVASTLRAEWACPGPTTADLLPFRDKYLMSRTIAAAGLPVEPFAWAPNEDAVRTFAARHGWPVVVKPRLASASEGVARVGDPAQLSCFRAGMLVQKYNRNPVYHVDGLFDRELVCWRAARYINTCLDFRLGSVLGSVEEDDPGLNAVIGRHAERFVAALVAGRPTVFHLEMFVDRQTGQCVFLEAGARAGGGETPFLWREVHGYDLVEQACRIQCGERPTPAPALGREIAGHLLIPAPAPRPCRIVEITPLVGSEPGPYAEALPRPGDVLPAADSYYEHVGGRFRFRGPSTAAVEEAILASAASFRASAEPVEPAEISR